MGEFIGWGSAAILLVTLIVQILAQWKSRSDVGVSPWLFVGQLLASVGFIAYSAIKRDAVFVVTNSLTAAVAVAGQILYLYLSHRRRPRKRGPR